MTYQIDIDGEIGIWGYSKRYVKNKISENKGKSISVRMNSLGGSLDHGIEIANQFREHGDVTVYLYGFNASAATVASLGAKKVVMDSSALYLVHKVSNWVSKWGFMNADEIQQVIEDLTKNKKENDKIDLVLARMYARKTKRKCDEIMDVLKEGTWITAQEALEYGFVDEIINNSEEKLNLTERSLEKLNAYRLPPPSNHSKNGTHNNSKPVMNEKYEKVNEALEVKGVEFVNGKANLTEEQLQKLNDKLEQLSKENQEKEETIKNLKENPGDDTTTHHDEDTGTQEEKNNIFSSSKELFNQVKDLI